MSTTTVPFHFDAKAPTTTTELEDGDLLPSGWALRTDEIDYEGERWEMSDRLWRSLRRFVDRKGPLAYQHQGNTIGIGRVLECERVEGVGVRVKAVIGHQPIGSPWHHIYESARKGYLPRLSLAGLFKRRQTPSGPVLEDAEFVELSICGSSVGRGTTWDLIERAAKHAPDGKAIGGDGSYVDATADDLKAIKSAISALKDEAMFWNRKTDHEDIPMVTTLYADDPVEEAKALQIAKAQERNRKADASAQAQTTDTGLGHVEETSLHGAWGVEPEKKNQDGQQTVEVTGDQLQAAYGVASQPQAMDGMPGFNPDIRGSALDVFNRKPSVVEKVADRLRKLESEKS